MFITWRTYNASTGPVEQRMDYACGHCGAQVAALVRTTGAGSSTAMYGVGGGVASAQQSAASAAWANATHAMSTVPCPQCGRLPPSLLDYVEALRAKVERRRRLRIPVAAAAAVVAGLLTIFPAVRDMRNSLSGLVAAMSAIMLVASFVAMLMSWPPTLPSLIRRAEVWLWWGHYPNPPGWVPASYSDVPAAPIPTMRAGQVIGAIASGISLLFGIIALCVLANSYVDVWVVDVKNSGDVAVEIDGAAVGHVLASEHAGDDVSWGRFDVRRGRTHKIVLIQPDGSRRELTLDDANDGKQGWVVAPGAAEHDLCIAESEIVYSSSSSAKPPQAKLLNEKGGDVLPVTESIDHTFTAPPQSISTKESEVRKRALRGYVCSELDADRLVPYGRRPVQPVTR